MWNQLWNDTYDCKAINIFFKLYVQDLRNILKQNKTVDDTHKNWQYLVWNVEPNSSQNAGQLKYLN